MSIVLQDLSLSVLHAGKRLSLIEGVNLVFPTKTMALIGESRLAVVATLDLLCRRLIPQRGAVHFNGAVSWPIGWAGPFSITITGTQAISHFATLYGFDRNQGLAFMKCEFAAPELLTLPMSTWPTALRTQFTMLMALLPAFDVYLIDASLIVLDHAAFSKRFLELYNIRRQGKTTLITARQTKVLHALCDGAIVVESQKIYLQNDLDTALAISNKITLETAPDEEKIEDIDDGFLL